ncbi:MAG: M28 family peptidase [Prevotella sp.]|nr:M28 family peptidase [Prevotella sp.]
MKRYIYFILLLLAITACGNKKASENSGDNKAQAVGPSFDADSAYIFCSNQCDFGPRTMNSMAHELCGEWIMNKFREYGCTVAAQEATLTGYDGTQLKSMNIIASYRPELSERVLVCAHWDSRPWADNDPDSANWHKPVLAANDGASGVAVMLEIARLLKSDSPKLDIGVDFVCFDAEDWGVPMWSEAPYSDGTWALGAQHWSQNLHKEGYTARFGILLDMVGGQGAQFWKESTSLQYANDIVKKVWEAAKVVGYGSYFPEKEGGMITDDHVPVNEKAKIPTIDIIPYYPDCEQSNFGPTWHTISDDMDHIDKNTLKAVGQTLIQVLYSE